MYLPAGVMIRPCGRSDSGRDWMCAPAQAVIAYSAIKQSLAAAIPDLDTYVEVKDPIVDLVIVTAEEWAMQTGWSTSTQAAGRRP